MEQRSGNTHEFPNSDVWTWCKRQMEIQDLLYCWLWLWTNIVTKLWSTGLDPLTYVSEPQGLFHPKPKPNSGILFLRCFKTESQWQVRGWGSMGLGCTQKGDWKGICPMLNAGQGVILSWLPMWKESLPAKVKEKNDQACLKGSGRYMGMLESEWGNWAFFWEERKPEVRVCSLTDTLTHRVCTPGQSSQVQVSSSVWSICEMFRLLNVYVISG